MATLVIILLCLVAVSLVVIWFDTRPRQVNADEVIVLFDGECRLCSAAAQRLRRLDRGDRLRLVSFRSGDVDRLAAEHGVELDRGRLENEMAVITGGRAYWGYDAVSRLARVLPGLWWLVPLTWLPGSTAAGDWVYRWVAQRRFKLAGSCKDGACAVHRGG